MLSFAIFWATDNWATTVVSKKTFRRTTVGRQRPKQFASNCSTLISLNTGCYLND